MLELAVVTYVSGTLEDAGSCNHLCRVCYSAIEILSFLLPSFLCFVSGGTNMEVRGQLLGGQLSPTTVVPGLEHRSPGLAASTPSQ